LSHLSAETIETGAGETGGRAVERIALLGLAIDRLLILIVGEVRRVVGVLADRRVGDGAAAIGRELRQRDLAAAKRIATLEAFAAADGFRRRSTHPTRY